MPPSQHPVNQAQGEGDREVEEKREEGEKISGECRVIEREKKKKQENVKKKWSQVGARTRKEKKMEEREKGEKGKEREKITAKYRATEKEYTHTQKKNRGMKEARSEGYKSEGERENWRREKKRARTSCE